MIPRPEAKWSRTPACFASRASATSSSTSPAHGLVASDPVVVRAPDHQILPAGRGSGDFGIVHRVVRVFLRQRWRQNGISARSHQVRVSCSGEYDTTPAPLAAASASARAVEPGRCTRRHRERGAIRRSLPPPPAKPRSFFPPSPRVVSFVSRTRNCANRVRAFSRAVPRRPVGRLIVDQRKISANFRLRRQRFDRSGNRRLFVARRHNRGNSWGSSCFGGTGFSLCAGDPVLEVHYRDPGRLATAVDLLGRAIVLGDEVRPMVSQVLEVIELSGGS